MSFSNSSIKTYEQCPFKYKLTRIDKLSEPTGDAAERGKRIHAEFESIIKEGLELYTEETAHWITYIAELKGLNAQSEVELGITRDWEPCGFSEGEVWLRGILDILSINNNIAYVADWKTGKERDYEEQLKLYATMIFATYPEVEQVESEIIYVDRKKRKKYETISREAFNDLQTWVNARINKIENDDIYAPKPDYGCRWCHFRKNNGGPCKW